LHSKIINIYILEDETMNWNLRRNKNFGNDNAVSEEAFGFEDEVMDEMDGEEAAVEAVGGIPTPVAPKEPIGFGASISLKIVNPKSYKEASDIADFLMNGNAVLVNIDGLAADQIVRLIDYLAGATHAVGGFMTKVGKSTVVIAPKNVDVSSIEAMVKN
jgi:cell division inhibitor SepF